jgi:uncharacterized NAD-dependent epimerase/dehydratase family protein
MHLEIPCSCTSFQLPLGEVRSTQIAEVSSHSFEENVIVDFLSGSMGECLIGLKNDGENDLIITQARGAIVHPLNYQYIIQNVKGTRKLH